MRLGSRKGELPKTGDPFPQRRTWHGTTCVSGMNWDLNLFQGRNMILPLLKILPFFQRNKVFTLFFFPLFLSIKGVGFESNLK
jgi:hypothetical protein